MPGIIFVTDDEDSFIQAQVISQSTVFTIYSPALWSGQGSTIQPKPQFKSDSRGTVEYVMHITQKAENN